MSRGGGLSIDAESSEQAIRIDRRCDMNIGKGVHTTNHTGYHRHGCPFLSLWEGVAHATGTAEERPTEPLLTARDFAIPSGGPCLDSVGS